VIFFFVLLVAMFLALVVQHFIGPVPVIGSRVLLMPIIMFYGALAVFFYGFRYIKQYVVKVGQSLAKTFSRF